MTVLTAHTISAANTHSNPWFSWRSLTQAETEFGMPSYTLDAERCVFSNECSTLIFHNGRRMAEIDGVTVWLNVAPEAQPDMKNWRIAAIDLDLVSMALQATPGKTHRKLKIMLDAGHGGNDPGAVSPCGNYTEKDINLDIALRIGKLLRNEGMEVLYTRTKDVACSLDERSAAASRKKADLFVSIHVNKASNTNAFGMETFVLTPSGYPGTAADSPPRGWQIGNKNDYNSNLLGFCIQKSLVNASQTYDRGLKRQSFFVLRETYCPAALVEVGFISNPDDLKKMTDARWRQDCAENLTAGILEYCRRVDRLDSAVAHMRRSRAEANKRWQQKLAAKADFDPERPTSQSVQATVTNIYLSQGGQPPTRPSERGCDLRSLMDFYETGSLN